MDSSREWYLIQTKPRQENTAELNLSRQRYTVYLPHLPVQKRIKGNLVDATVPMFPRYLFIELSAKEDNWGPIRSTRGVAGLVRFGGIAARVPRELVALLKQKEQAMKLAGAKQPEFGVGDSVRVASGVLKGYEGIITEKSNKKRVTLLLKIVGQAAELEVPVDTLINAN